MLSQVLASLVTPAVLFACGNRLWPVAALTSIRSLHNTLSVDHVSIAASAGYALCFRELLELGLTQLDLVSFAVTVALFELLWRVGRQRNFVGLSLCEYLVGLQTCLFCCHCLATSVLAGSLPSTMSAASADVAAQVVPTVLVTGMGLLFLLITPLVALKASLHTATRSVAFYSSWSAIVGLQYWLLWNVLALEPFSWMTAYVLGDGRRYWFVLAWAASVMAIVAFVPRPDERRGGKTRAKADTEAADGCEPRKRASPLRRLLLRKVFHFAAAAMFLPSLLYCETSALFLCVALAVAAEVLLSLEGLRACSVWPGVLSSSLDSFMRHWADERDEGPYVRTHIYLLVGCAFPVWMTLASPAPDAAAVTGTAGIALLSPSAYSSQLGTALLVRRMSGVIALGIGDAAAAVVGAGLRARGRGHTWGSVWLGVLDGLGMLDDEDEEGGRGAGEGCVASSTLTSSNGESEQEGRKQLDCLSSTSNLESTAITSMMTTDQSAAAAASHPAPSRVAAAAAAEDASLQQKRHATQADAARASLISWPGAEKTVEGTAAFAVTALLASLACVALQAGMRALQSEGALDVTVVASAMSASVLSASLVLRLAAVAGGTSLVETFCGSIDNALVPAFALLFTHLAFPWPQQGGIMQAS